MKIKGLFILLLCCACLCSCNRETVEAQPIGRENASSSLELVDVGETRLHFVAAGDNLIHGNVYIDAREKNTDETKEFDFLPMYSAIASIIEDADIAFINQESVIAGNGFRYSGYPRFNTPSEMGDTLCELGFDVINVINNHMLDKGEKGLQYSIDFWQEKDVLLIGGYTADNPNDVRIMECEGIKIAFLGYTDWTNGLYLPSSSKLYIPYTDDDLIKEQISLAKEYADLVFVSMHWGKEDEKEENEEQRRIAQLICDSGADVIIGTHPHVLQGIEWLEGVDGNKTLVTYSLGNLMSTQQYGRNLISCLLSFDIVLDATGLKIDNVLMTPVITQYSEKDYRYDWLVKDIYLCLLEDYTTELAEAHGCRYLDTAFSLEWAKNYVKQAVSEDFLPDWLK